MRSHRSHLLYDGTMVALLTLASFGIFYLVMAQGLGDVISGSGGAGGGIGNLNVTIPPVTTPAPTPTPAPPSTDTNTNTSTNVNEPASPPPAPEPAPEPAPTPSPEPPPTPAPPAMDTNTNSSTSTNEPASPPPPPTPAPSPSPAQASTSAPPAQPVPSVNAPVSDQTGRADEHAADAATEAASALRPAEETAAEIVPPPAPPPADPPAPPPAPASMCGNDACEPGEETACPGDCEPPRRVAPAPRLTPRTVTAAPPPVDVCQASGARTATACENVRAAEKEIKEIDARVTGASAADGTLDLAALAVRADDTHAKVKQVLEIEPSSEVTLAVLPSQGQILVREDDSVRAAAGSLITYDADGDGLPDDVERRHGLDPASADSDGDGVPDGRELARTKLSGIDKAIVGRREIGQPITQGVTDAAMTVDLSGRGGAGRGATFSGTAPPGAVVTLYVYSDLPMIMTTVADENGRWTFTMDDALKDGDHEVYAVINDDTGKVLKKSEPLAFVVRAAVAASEEDLAAEAERAQAARMAVAIDAVANAHEYRASEVDVKVYLFACAALTLIAMLIVTVVMRKQGEKGRR